jgi:hypothetical protein
MSDSEDEDPSIYSPAYFNEHFSEYIGYSSTYEFYDEDDEGEMIHNYKRLKWDGTLYESIEWVKDWCPVNAPPLISIRPRHNRDSMGWGSSTIGVDSNGFEYELGRDPVMLISSYPTGLRNADLYRSYFTI